MPIGFVKRHAEAFELCLRGADVALVAASGLACYAVIHGSLDEVSTTASLFVVVLLLTAMVTERAGLYRPWRGMAMGPQVKRCIAASGCVLAFVALLTIPIPELDGNSRWNGAWYLAWWLTSAAFLVSYRMGLRALLNHLRARGFNLRRVALACFSPAGVRAEQSVSHNLWSGYRVVGYCDDRLHPRCSTALPRLDSIAGLRTQIVEKGIDEVWVSLPFTAESRVRRILHELRYLPVTVRFLVDTFAFDSMTHSASEVAGVPVMNIHASPLDSGLNRVLKGTLDRTVALLALLLLSQLMLVTAVAVKLSSEGPILYRQERIGWRNKPFAMLKFRTMPVDVEAGTGPVWAKAGERRATCVGRFLRCTSLDELPQLFNVLKGDMSLVGPRPERPEFVQVFKDEVPLYMKKHMVKAGMTGWAQVNGWRGDTDLQKRIECDLYYIQNWSLLFDLEILLKTLTMGFVHKNAY